jgi:hypothetical protein
MRSLKIVAIASVAAAALGTASAAMAADPIVMIDTPPPPMAAVYGLDGPYAGVFVLGSAGGPNAIGIGVDIGVNMASNGLLFGVEGDAAWESSGDWDLQVHGKLGAMLSDQAAIFVLAGLGTNTANGTYVPLGVGAEFGIADNMSLAASVEYDWDMTAPGASPVVGKLGVNFHF